MNAPGAARRTFPRLPILGWSAFSGEHETLLPGVLDARYHRYTVSGRAAIGLALQIVGVQPGNRALVPTYHCPTMIAPVVLAGLEPVFYPVTARGAPDLDWLQRADLAGVQVMLATHYFGLPQPMAAIRAFCDQRWIALIEDCAHSFFGASDGRPVGSWGNVAIASLTKFFPVPEGGLIVSDSLPLDALQLARRSLREEIKALSNAVEIGVEHDGFTGLNSLLGGVFTAKRWLRNAPPAGVSPPDAGGEQAADPALRRLLSSIRPAFAARWIAGKVHRLRIVEARRRNYLALARGFAGVEGVRVLRPDLPETAVPYVFPLYVDHHAASYQRLRATGVPIFRWDEIWPGTPSFDGDHGVDWATAVFQLGCHQDLSPGDIEVIVRLVRETIRT